MRIVQMVADGRPGGGSTVVLGLVDRLLAAGARELALVSQPDSYLQQQASQRGLDFFGLDFFGLPGDPRIVRRLAEALGTRTFDLSHVHGLRAAHYAASPELRPALGRIVYTVHGLHQMHWPQPARWLANVAERRVMRRVDARVFVSQADLAAAGQAALLGAALSAQVIPNGIDLEAVRHHSCAEQDIDVAFVGRLDRPKGPLAAARVLATLATEGYRCVLAGDGPLSAATAEVLANAPGGALVGRRGALAHGDALDLVARTRILVMPSLWEGLPVLPMEAMALGVPVVASRLSGIAEVIADGRTGVLVECGDQQAFVDAVRALLDDPSRLQSMRTAGLERVRQCFDQARTFAQYRDLYERLGRSPAR